MAFGNEFTSEANRLQVLIADTAARLKRPGYGETALLDALQESAGQFGAAQPGDTVVVITDGGENKSKVSQKEVERQFAQKGIRMFVLLIREPPSSPAEIGAVGLMAELAERRGGAVHTIDAEHVSWDDREWALHFQEDLNTFWKDQVLSACLFDFSVPTGQQKKRKWFLVINPAANKQRQMAAGYPSRIEPCALNTAVH